LPALRKALALPRTEETSRIIVIATDGFIDVESKAFNLIRDQLGDANFFAFGIGTSVNRHLIEGLAHVGMGEPFIVTKPEEAEAAAARFLQYIKSPILSRINIEYEGFDASDIEPKEAPDMFAERPIVVFGKWHGTAQGSIAITGRTARDSFHERVDIASGMISQWEPLRYLWARHRVKNLADYGGLPAPGAQPAPPADSKIAQQISEVTQLGLKYSLLTPYTSFVAVDHVVRSDGQIEQVVQPLPIPQGVTDSAIGSRDLIEEFKVISGYSGSQVLYKYRSRFIDVPLRGHRNWQELLPLISGVTLPVASSVESFLSPAGTGPHINGQSRSDRTFQIKGIEVGWGAIEAQSLIPIIDAVDDFRANISSIDAKLSTGVGVATIRTGTNHLHGSA
jgi:hypothetical protein